MKVKLGCYKNDVRVYRFFDKFERLIGEKWCDRLCDLFQPAIDISHNNRSWNKRNIKVKIEKHDVWSLDHTLALIIVPLLKEYKCHIQGGPLTANEDGPIELKSKKYTKKQIASGDMYDDLNQKRWEWIIDEMIWAFEQVIDDDIDDQYYSGEYDMNTVLQNPDDPEDKHIYKLVKGPNHTMKFNKKAYLAHKARMDNGFRLFGKYYSNLWT